MNIVDVIRVKVHVQRKSTETIVHVFFLFLSFYVDLLVMENLIRATNFCALLNYECTGTNIS